MVLKEFVERPLIMSAVRRADLPASLHIPPGRLIGPLPPVPPPVLDVGRLPPPAFNWRSAQQRRAERGNLRRYTAAMKWQCYHRRRRRRFTVTNKCTSLRHGSIWCQVFRATVQRIQLASDSVTSEQCDCSVPRILCTQFNGSLG